ncbi:outer membrane lipoprotein-sorting protein [candidate division KSB1 bacterium]
MKQTRSPLWIILLLITAFLAGTGNTTLPAQTGITAERILDKLDENMYSTTIIYTAKMVITRGSRIDEKIMKVWGEGKDKGYIEFLEPARDKGTKYLKLEDNLWMYLPNVEKVIKISGHLLRQSMMGSDFSYEDSMERSKMREDYSAVLLGEEAIKGRPCFILELTAAKREVTYYRRKIWVDKEQYIALQSELYAKTGKLLKVMTTQKIEQFKGRNYATHITMTDKLKRNSRTEIILGEMQFDVEIPPSTFTRRNLEKK